MDLFHWNFVQSEYQVSIPAASSYRTCQDFDRILFVFVDPELTAAVTIVIIWSLEEGSWKKQMLADMSDTGLTYLVITGHNIAHAAVTTDNDNKIIPES